MNPVGLPIIPENASLEEATLGARGDSDGNLTRPFPSEAERSLQSPSSSEDRLTVARGRQRSYGVAPLQPPEAVQYLGFLLGLREVSPSAEETTAAPPSQSAVIYLFSNKGGAPLLSI